MNMFVCVWDPGRVHLPAAARQVYEAMPRSRGLSLHWQYVAGVWVLTAEDGGSAAARLTAVAGPYGATGVVRLDNREEIRHLAQCKITSLADLELVLLAFAAHGPDVIRQFLGDFAFVVWNHATHNLVAACDAFRVRRLYYRHQNGVLAFASRAEALAVADRYNVGYLAERVAGCAMSPDTTVYDGVRPVPAGALVSADGKTIMRQQYWHPGEIDPDPKWLRRENEAIETCRALLIQAVQLRLGQGTDTWAQLSGGLDSSSVACVAQWLFERGETSHGLSGTVTYVDREGTPTDERLYSNAVINQWGLRNATIVDPPIWADNGVVPPRIDQPRYDLMLYPRERRLCEIVRAAGGRILLTGQGSDELMRGNMFFFADWLARGHVSAALAEMLKRAAIGRASFWELAFRNAIVPLLPRRLQLGLAGAEAQLAAWLHPDAVHRYRLHDRVFEGVLYAGRIGRKYQHTIVTNLVGLGTTIGYVLLEDHLDVRHPFLYRPLAEFVMQLPPELCVRPHQRKWILREAMRGILPEFVRTRVGKGRPAELYAWSLSAQQALLEPLVRDPILADLGIVEGSKLRAAFTAAPRESDRRGDPHGTLQGVLAIEAWLQMRHGRWPRGGHPSSTLH